jgi:hypothetical protein
LYLAISSAIALFFWFERPSPFRVRPECENDASV